MDITKLAQIQRHAKVAQKTLSAEEDASLYYRLSISLAELFATKQREEAACLDPYCKVLANFLALANAKKWVYLLLVSEEKEKNLALKWKNRSDEKAYLSLQQQLLKAYLERRSEYFVRAWNIFLKIGLADLKYSPKQIADRFEYLL